MPNRLVAFDPRINQFTDTVATEGGDAANTIRHMVLRPEAGDLVRHRPQHGGSARSALTAGVSMPFKSKAQRRKFAELLVKGEISEETFEEWNRETGRAKLPERVRPKPARSRGKRKAKPGSRPKAKRKARPKPKAKAKRR